MNRIFRYVVLPLLVAFCMAPTVKAENSLLKFFTNTTSSESEAAAAELDELMWEAPRGRFLPHATQDSENALAALAC